MNQFEQDLVATLHGAAEASPRPRADFLAGVRLRQRRRSRRRWATVAVAGALSLVAVFVVVGYGRPRLDSQPATPQPCPSASPQRAAVPIIRLLKPAAQAWPCAVHTLPASLPDETPYQVAAVLGANRYLVTTGWLGSDTRPNPSITATRVGVFDTRSVRWLSPPGLDERLLRAPLVDGDRVVWATSAASGSIGIWSASVSAGSAIQLAQLSPGDRLDVTPTVGAPRIVADTVLWTAYPDSRDAVPAGIWSVPALGGPAGELPGTAGYELVTGAWARQARPAGATGDDLVNVLTGQHLPIPYRGEKHDERLDCTPFWCAGPGAERHAYAMLPAGGGPGPTELGEHYWLVAGGRVAVARVGEDHANGPGVAVWNPTTGVSALLDARYALPGAPSADLSVLTTAPDPTHPMEVFDLRAVGAS